MFRVVLFVGVALVLPLASVTAPSAQTWPGNDDKVYVAATLKSLSWKTGVSAEGVPGATYVVTNDMEPCKVMAVRDAKPDKLRWTGQFFEMWGPKVQLEGPWLSRMHKTEADCRSQLAAEGEPKVTRSGTTYKIIPAK